MTGTAVETGGVPLAEQATDVSGHAEILAAIGDLSGLVSDLVDRLSELEDSVAENAEDTLKLCHAVDGLKKVVATRTQLKKLGKLEKLSKKMNTLLDRIEVVDEGMDE